MRALLRIVLAMAAMVVCLVTVQPEMAQAVTIPSTSELLSPPPGSNGETYSECIDQGAAAANIASDFYYANEDGLGPVWQWYTQDFTPAYLNFVRGCEALQNGGSGGSTGGSGGGSNGGGTSTPQLDCQAAATSSVTSLDPGQSISVQANAPAGASIDSVSVSWGDGSVSAGTTNASHVYATPAATTTYTVQVYVTGIITDANGSHPCTTSIDLGTVEVFSLPWNTLLDRAEALYAEAQKLGVTAIGYYQQILNLVCAASQSHRASCSAMIASYANAPAGWAGTWTYTVFSSYLTDLDQSRIDDQLRRLQAVVDDAEAVLPVVCNPFDGFSTLSEVCGLVRLGLVTPGDEASLIVGTLHFWNDLGPGFQTATNGVVQQIPAGASLSDIGTVLAALRAEHQNLFDHAVVPGFDAVAGSGQLSPLAAAVAKIGVPLFADVYREESIVNALVGRYGLLEGLSIYAHTLTR